MGIDRLVNMIARQVIARLVRRGVDAGMDRLARGTGGGRAGAGAAGGEAAGSNWVGRDGAGDAAQAGQGRETAKRGRKAMRLSRNYRKF